MFQVDGPLKIPALIESFIKGCEEQGGGGTVLSSLHFQASSILCRKSMAVAFLSITYTSSRERSALYSAVCTHSPRKRIEGESVRRQDRTLVKVGMERGGGNHHAMNTEKTHKSKLKWNHS